MFLILILLGSSFFLSSAEAKPFNEIERSLLQLERIAMKTQIVESDMRLYIDRPDFYGNRKEASKDALAKLQVIRKDLKALAFPPEVEVLRPMYESSIVRLEIFIRISIKKVKKRLKKKLMIIGNLPGY